jgi:hypothetical protein
MRDTEAIAALDQFYPPCGPCAFCDLPDKRHRLWDSMLDSPDDDKAVAWEFDTTIEHVRAVRRVRPYRDGGEPLTPNAKVSGAPATK